MNQFTNFKTKENKNILRHSLSQLLYRTTRSQFLHKYSQFMMVIKDSGLNSIITLKCFMIINCQKKYHLGRTISLHLLKWQMSLCLLLIQKKFHQFLTRKRELVRMKGKILGSHSAKCRKIDFPSRNNILIKYHQLQFNKHLLHLIKLKRVKMIKSNPSLQLILNLNK